MAGIAEGVATNFAQRLNDGAIRQVNYLCCFNSHAENFEKEKNVLAAKRKGVLKDIEEAKNRNETEVEDDVQLWLDETERIIQEDTETKKKCVYGWCLDCIWQHQQGRKLVKKMPYITNLIERCNFNRVARAAKSPGIEYYSPQIFVDFESRKSKLRKLVMALKDGNYYMIGLQGMGGSGKTTLATQVGKEVENSKAFPKVIFTVVSTPPDLKKVQGDITKQLDFPLKEGREEEHSKDLWSRIVNYKERILIILDDVWGEINLKDIGIPSGNDHKNCCVLVTTRDSKVCGDMGCQPTIHLQTLTDEEAFNLFLTHANEDNLSSSALKGVALDIVKECGGLPIVIVAIARTLKNWPQGEWKEALKTLQNSQPLVDVHEDLIKVYKCLSLSYENLQNEKAKRLFLLCSLFPEDYEIPVSLFISLGIGAGTFREVDNYCIARRQALVVKNDLIASSLLLMTKKQCIKMHDLVREVALWIGKEDIQVIVDQRTLKAKKRFLFWNYDDFPDQFDGIELEILFLWVNGQVLMKNPYSLFKRMEKLKVLFLLCKFKRKCITPSLSRSLFALENIQTVIFHGWKIADFSSLRNLQSLKTLELENCFMIEVPKAIQELEKLRMLGLRKCEIERNNPFEVIGRCSQLEELYFVDNKIIEEWKPKNDGENIDEDAHDTSPRILQMYSIACSGFQYYDDDDNGLLRCFNTAHVKTLISSALFEYLVKKAEVLELGKIGETGWNNLVPNIIPLEDGGMNDLLKLCLYEWDDIECLIDCRNHHHRDVTVFTKLVELHLDGVDVKELYLGPMPSSFLRQLQIMKLEKCKKLHNIFFDGDLKLPHLKVLELKGCPMFQPSIFQSSVARSLAQLEELRIKDCNEVKSLITYESSTEELVGVDHQNSHGLLFPRLKTLQIYGCEKLEQVAPLLLAGDLPLLEELSICYCCKMRCIFGEYRDEGQVLHNQEKKMIPSLIRIYLEGVPSLISLFGECKNRMQRLSPTVKDDTKEKHSNSKAQAFSWAHGCCFLPAIKDSDIVNCNPTISQELCVANKGISTFGAAECFLTQSLHLRNIRQMTLYGCSKVKSLFSVSIALTMIMLEKLEIRKCEELKHIITNEGEDHHPIINCSSFFPKLQHLYISFCDKLEFIFPSTFSGGLPKLKYIHISFASQLKYVFGEYNHEDCESNDELNICLPALETLYLHCVPNMISFCFKKHHLECSSLQKLETPEGLCVSKKEIQIFGTANSLLTQPLQLHNIRRMTLWGCSKVKSLFSVSIASTIIVTS